MTLMRRRDEAGFALPLTLFVLTLVTIMLAALMVQVQNDRRIASSSGDLVETFTIAQGGLRDYLSYYSESNTRPLNGDSLRINVVGGYADVVAHIVQQPADTLNGIVYLIRSRGRLIKPTQGADPQAVRVVAQYVRWQYGTMRVYAAFAPINSFTCSSCDGTFQFLGYDQCAVAPTVPGMRTPNGPTPYFAPPYVDPAVVEGPVTSTFASKAFIGIDWAAVLGSGFSPDYTTLTSLDTWSSYRLAGNQTLTNVSGTGLLVVQGNLTLDDFYWQGVVLVGGRIVFAADTSQVEGAVVSGLQDQIGAGASAGRWGPAGSHIAIQYNSCNVAQAFSSMTGFAPIAGGWMDNWASY
jgi:hypothetical protein